MASGTGEIACRYYHLAAASGDEEAIKLIEKDCP
jgi:hypothetical protein